MGNYQKYLLILTLQLFVLFTTAILGTFLSDWLTSLGFFSTDWTRTVHPYGDTAYIKEEWGARHTWYGFFCFTMLCCGILRIIFWSIEFWDKKESI